MTKTHDTIELTHEESEILDHANKCHLHVKRVERHNAGHVWYCFECNGLTSSSVADSEKQHYADHKVFDTDRKMKHHMMETHGVVW